MNDPMRNRMGRRGLSRRNWVKGYAFGSQSIHTLFFHFSHLSSIGWLQIVVADEVENAMDEIEERLFVGIQLPLLAVFDGSLGADVDFAESRVVYGEGNAVGGAWVVEELLVKLADFLLRDEADRDLVARDLQVGEEFPDR